ncbi:hypothetical protein BT69DRAFT_1277314 [Atractiella rhizophila]|nr:hypothetical protein BT69DRAFT_1277314 [Atractiella rhizophila]
MRWIKDVIQQSKLPDCKPRQHEYAPYYDKKLRCSKKIAEYIRRLLVSEPGGAMSQFHRKVKVAKGDFEDSRKSKLSSTEITLIVLQTGPFSRFSFYTSPYSRIPYTEWVL